MSFTKITIPKNVINTQYAVRGYLANKSEQYGSQLLAGKGASLPFDEIHPLNIGNPQAIGQRPLTYIREITSLLINPKLFDTPQAFHPGHVDMAREIYNGITNSKGHLGKDFGSKPNYGGLGAYSASRGNGYLIESVNDFLSRRDGYETPKSTVFLCNGASSGARSLYTMLSEGNFGVMGPIPVYPLYSGYSDLYRGNYVGYHLDEDKGWGLDINEIENQYKHSKENGIENKCLVLINPGNPTGNVLSREDIVNCLHFCRDNNLIVVADEVYQENLWDDNKQFYGVRRVAHEENIKVPIVTMHSTSKGFYGECGFRGGFFQLENFGEEFMTNVEKLVSISLCSNLPGQLAMSLVCNPPTQGDAQKLFLQEKEDILGSLKRKSMKMYQVLDGLDGIFPQKPQGAMYSFPRIEFSDKYISDSWAEGKAPDLKFAEYILDHTGIVVVNGSGFGQREGTWHFRITNLLHESKIDFCLDNFSKAYKSFRQQYG